MTSWIHTNRSRLNGNDLINIVKKVSIPKLTFLMVLWLGIIVIVLMCLYPPWIETVRLPSSNIKGTNSAGYGFLWHPPSTGSRYSGIAIDYSRLLLQFFAVGLITGGLLYTLKAKKKE